MKLPSPRVLGVTGWTERLIMTWFSLGFGWFCCCPEARRLWLWLQTRDLKLAHCQQSPGRCRIQSKADHLTHYRHSRGPSGTVSTEETDVQSDGIPLRHLTSLSVSFLKERDHGFVVAPFYILRVSLLTGCSNKTKQEPLVLCTPLAKIKF